MGRTSGPGATNLLSPPTANHRPERRNRPGNQEAPGTNHRGGNRLREIDPDPQDVPRRRAGNPGTHRLHPAPASDLWLPIFFHEIKSLFVSL